MGKRKMKCTIRDGRFVEPCAALLECTQAGNPRGKQRGIYAWNLWNINLEAEHMERGPSRTFFGVKSGDHVTDGMVFNFCPFCGEAIDAPASRSKP